MHGLRLKHLAAFSAVVITAVSYQVMAADNAAGLRSKLKSASTTLKDLKADMVVTGINKQNAGEINPAFADIGQFQKATIYYKYPDRFRADGIAKGMPVSYVSRADQVQIVIPGVLKRVENVSDKPGKQRSTLDMGFVTDLLWKNNTVTQSVEEKGLVKLNLRPKGSKSKRHELIWVDSNTLKLVKRQRYGSDGNMRARYAYEDFKTFGRIPVARKAKIYAQDGGYVGTVEYRGMKANTGMAESMFTLVR